MIKHAIRCTVLFMMTTSIPDTVGQRMMAEAIEPTLAHLMNDPPKFPATTP